METKVAAPRYANWSRKRTSLWHRTVGESDQPLCGMTVRRAPEWSHSSRPTDLIGRPPVRFCEPCERLAQAMEAEK